MLYRKFSPCSTLQPFVECYFVWQSQEDKALLVESPPSGYCSIVFNYGCDYVVKNKKYERLVVPRQFAAGQSIYSYSLSLNGPVGMAGIVFKPAALATLFKLSTFEFTEERIDLYKVLNPSCVFNYRQRIMLADSIEQKARLLEEFAMLQYLQHEPQPDAIDEAANTIVAKNGMLNITELMEGIYMSRRNFERKFFQKVGLSPKYYARIRRIGYLCNMIAGKQKADWPSLLYECEYYDQSHFIKDFEEFTGRTPQQYLQENAELARLVEKPKQQSLM
ncbi:helix-turn-helix domain-containing protein [Foetidibacter luteolus]|uniref:helix-turn-helix domain-containing protein n=1 Tax=Foetidibacter luteolus TaxID=2608880 RepID=UPI00129A8BA0|nr:helix-turn-helix domain-containing protein [Foetidibacter luteolus]